MVCAKATEPKTNSLKPSVQRGGLLLLYIIKKQETATKAQATQSDRDLVW